MRAVWNWSTLSFAGLCRKYKVSLGKRSGKNLIWCIGCPGECGANEGKCRRIRQEAGILSSITGGKKLTKLLKMGCLMWELVNHIWQSCISYDCEFLCHTLVWNIMIESVNLLLKLKCKCSKGQKLLKKDGLFNCNVWNRVKIRQKKGC